MNIGDFIIDNEGKRWVIFDFFGDNKDVLGVYDPTNPIFGDVVVKEHVIEIIEKPTNVTHLKLFLRNRKHKELFGKNI